MPAQPRERLRIGREGGFVRSSFKSIHIREDMEGVPEISFDPLTTFPIENDDLLGGTPVGISDETGTPRLVCIPEANRSLNCRLVGVSSSGRMDVIKHICNHDIRSDIGIAVLDIHGDLTEYLLQLIPPSHADRVILMDVGDPEWIPSFNLFSRLPGQSHSRMADELVGVLRNITSGWRDKSDILFRYSIQSLSRLPNSCLYDVLELLGINQDKSKHYRNLLRDYVIETT
ncbi:hypothetical protein ACFL1X_14500, partial [Candidatus Hydrogenedentota bacterium]